MSQTSYRWTMTQHWKIQKVCAAWRSGSKSKKTTQKRVWKSFLVPGLRKGRYWKYHEDIEKCQLLWPHSHKDIATKVVLGFIYSIIYPLHLIKSLPTSLFSQEPRRSYTNIISPENSFYLYSEVKQASNLRRATDDTTGQKYKCSIQKGRNVLKTQVVTERK